MHYLTPLSTNYRPNPDFNELDALAEFEALKYRQQATSAMLDGDLHPNDLLDLLEEQAIDPMEYVDAMVQAVNFVIDNQLPIEGWL